MTFLVSVVDGGTDGLGGVPLERNELNDETFFQHLLGIEPRIWPKLVTNWHFI